MNTFATPRNSNARFPVVAGLIGGAVCVVAFIACAAPAKAQVAADTAIMLDPFDPVPEIAFKHYGGYAWGYGGYRHGHHDCRGRDCCRHGHCREERREIKFQRDESDDAWQHYNEQSNRYDNQSCWYQRKYIGGECEKRYEERHEDRDRHEGHGDHHDNDHHEGDHHDSDHHDSEENHHGDGDHRDSDHHDGEEGNHGDGDHHDHHDGNDAHHHHANDEGYQQNDRHDDYDDEDDDDNGDDED